MAAGVTESALGSIRSGSTVGVVRTGDGKGGMSNPNCEEFLRQLNELFSSDEAIEEHPHYTTCVQCRSLIRDIKLIIENAPLREPDSK